MSDATDITVADTTVAKTTLTDAFTPTDAVATTDSTDPTTVSSVDAGTLVDVATVATDTTADTYQVEIGDIRDWKLLKVWNDLLAGPKIEKLN